MKKLLLTAALWLIPAVALAAWPSPTYQGMTILGVAVGPTAAPLTNNGQLATTGYTDAAVGVEKARATAAEALKAPLASPTLTGTINLNGNTTANALFNTPHNISGVSTGYSNTGLTTGWNYNGGQGEVDLLLGPQGGPGGLNMYQLNSSGNITGGPIFQLSGAGNLSAASMNSTPIGAATPSTAAFTNLSASGTTSLTGNTTMGGAATANGGLTLNNTGIKVNEQETASGGVLSPAITSAVGAFSGTVTGSGEANLLNISNDTAACGAICSNLWLTTGINSGATGGRAMIYSNLVQGSAATQAGQEMIGMDSIERVNYDADGDFWQPLASDIVLGSGATNVGNTLDEIDYTAKAGSSVGTKGGLLISIGSGDAVAGTYLDAGLIFSNANPYGVSPGMGSAISLGNLAWGNPLNPTTGHVLNYTDETGFGNAQNVQFIPGSTGYGIDLRNLYFYQNAFDSSNFSITGAGVENIGQATITPGAAGLTIDTTRQRLVSVVVSNGGTGTGGVACYYVGDIVNDTYGDQFQVATVSGCQAATLTILTYGSTASPPGSPVALSGGSGAGLTATETFGAANALSLNPSGGAVSINGVTVKPNLSGTTGSIGGSALVAGACSASTVSVSAATTSMAVDVSPASYPGDGVFWHGYVSAVGVVTVKVCASVAETPVASTYNVRVLQ